MGDIHLALIAVIKTLLVASLNACLWCYHVMYR